MKMQTSDNVSTGAGEQSERRKRSPKQRLERPAPDRGALEQRAKKLRAKADRLTAYREGLNWRDVGLEVFCDAVTKAAWARVKATEAEAKVAKLRVRCGAKTRAGAACQAQSEPGKRRCPLHGGKSVRLRHS